MQHPGNAPHRGPHAGRGDDRAAPTVSGDRAAEDRIVTIAERDFLRYRGDVLCDRQAFTRKGGLGGLQRDGLDQPGVRRNRITLLDQDDIARDEFDRRNASSFAVAQDGRLRRRHPAQGRYGLLGAGLLDIADHCVEKYDREDRERLVGQPRGTLVEPQRSRDKHGEDEQKDERVSELRKERFPCGNARLCLKLVPTVARSELSFTSPRLSRTLACQGR